ncbi:hypothetical protein CLIB1423_06S00672 [[Candida] railenensis]|uniref:RSE1/DDB1/CPSF1 first beta-propeller domain-containing protein n=1 Tax=[Candida] railenensis TaxID=45579 RepID=A0A9P0QNU8_9ASCO|nr:hypothetical protein CLIB1423_06S00672 [[Candida] railenensis]
MSKLLLTSELQRGSEIEDALYIKSPITKVKDCLVLWRDGSLEFYEHVHTELKLVEILPIGYQAYGNGLGSTSPFTNLDVTPEFPIAHATFAASAVTSYSLNENEPIFVVYYEGPQTLRFFHYNTSLQKFSLDNVINLENTSKLPKTLETRPILMMDPHYSYLVLHAFQGYIHCLNILPNIQNRIVTTSIGTITVSYMSFLHNTEGETYLAVVYRDFRFNYSLRYYKLDTSLGNFTLYKQFNDFEMQPTGIVAPLSGGLLVFSEVHVFYFPNPSMKLSLPPESYQDRSISINTRENVLTKLLVDSSNIKENEITSLCSYAVIDENRILAISKSGIAYMIHFNSLITSGSLEVKSFTFFKLSFTTICKKILYLGSGSFFGISSLSRSIHFTVGPQTPYINVISEFTSSPPVLSLEVDPENNQIFSCQGGYESGEYRNITKRPSSIKLLSTFIRPKSNHQSGNRLIINGKKSVYSLSLLSSQGSVDASWQINLQNQTITHTEQPIEENLNISGIIAVGDDGDHIITDSGLISLKEGRCISTGSIIDGIFLDDNSYIVLLRGSGKNTFELHYKDTSREKKTIFTVRDDNNKNSEFVDMKHSGSYVLVTFNDYYYVLRLQGNQVTLLIEVPIVDVYSTGIEYREGKLWTLFSFEDGQFLQQCIEVQENMNHKFVPYKSVFSNLKKEQPCKIVSGPDEILLYNKEIIEVLRFNNITNFFENIELPKKMKNLRYVGRVNKKHFIYLKDDGGIGFFVMKISSTLHVGGFGSTLFSNSLNLKSLCVPNTTFSLLLGFEFKYSESLGEIVKTSFVNLIDNVSMKVVNSIILKDCKDAVDISLCSDDECIFIVLDNSNTSPLHTYKIDTDTGKMMKQRDTNIEELKDNSMNFQSIKHIANGLYLITGSKIFIVEGISNVDVQIWRLRSKVVKQSVFTSVSALLGDKIAVLDIFRGCQMLNATEDEEKDGEGERELILSLESPFKSVRSSFEDLYTSLTVSSIEIDLTKKYQVFIGDSRGSVVVEELPKDNLEEITFPFINFGSQINSIEAIKTREISSFERSFSNKIELHDEIEVNIVPQILVGTADGGIHMVSYAREEIVPVIEECYQEISKLHNEASMKKKRKVRRQIAEPEEWAARHGTSEIKNSFTSNLFYNFLVKVKEEGLDRKKFPSCSENINLIERIVYETSAIRMRR